MNRSEVMLRQNPTANPAPHEAFLAAVVRLERNIIRQKAISKWKGDRCPVTGLPREKDRVLPLRRELADAR